MQKKKKKKKKKNESSRRAPVVEIPVTLNLLIRAVKILQVHVTFLPEAIFI